jgi:hypothetical protein
MGDNSAVNIEGMAVWDRRADVWLARAGDGRNGSRADQLHDALFDPATPMRKQMVSTLALGAHRIHDLVDGDWVLGRLAG